jgi:cell division protease FtsH
MKGNYIMKKDIKTTLDKVAGYEEEKEEITKIIKLLNNYEKYEKMGIDIPKGLILQGPAGTGKTLMAKAIAGECNIPFFYFQALDGVEKSLLDNLSEVFNEAYKHIPSIVYIDEIDKIVTNEDYASDTSRAVVQYLLTQLDGAQSKRGLMVIASTNCYRDIPKALLRSGRMDKKILIDRPTLSSRIKIIKQYINSYPIFSKLDINTLAVKIDGMTGADIKTLINNTLIEYIDDKEFVQVNDFQKIINNMRFETIGKRWNYTKVLNKVLIHEVGHSLIDYYFKGKASAITGTQYGSILGFTDDIEYEIELEEEDDFEDLVVKAEEAEVSKINVDKKSIIEDCIKCLGGMVSEKIYYGFYDTGCGSDLNSFETYLRSLLNYGYINFKYRQNSEYNITNHQIDIINKYRDKFFKKCYKKTYRILKSYKYLGLYIVKKTIENNNCLSQVQINNVIKEYYSNKKELDRLCEKFYKTKILENK